MPANRTEATSSTAMLAPLGHVALRSSSTSIVIVGSTTARAVDASRTSALATARTANMANQPSSGGCTHALDTSRPSHVVRQPIDP